MKRSVAQRERQSRDHRVNGRYAATNPCMCCGKSAGIDFFSHPLTDTGGWDDMALVLCNKCFSATQDMTDPNQFESYKKQFGDAADTAWAKTVAARDNE